MHEPGAEQHDQLATPIAPAAEPLEAARPDLAAARDTLEAVAWLERYQNADAGWGEDPRSYADRSLTGQGATTPSQTAWALLAMLEQVDR